MKTLFVFAAPLLLTAASAAEWPKDAEQRFQMKYGRPSPVAAQTQDAQKQAAKKKAKPSFEALDTNRDGKIDRDEWDKYHQQRPAEAGSPSGATE